MAIKSSHLMSGDVTPEADVSFPLNLGKEEYNTGEVGKIFRHAWENQNVDVHQGTLVRVMTSLMNWKASQGIGTYKSHQAYVNVKDKNGRGDIETVSTVPVELKDFDILPNSEFKGLTNDKKAGINPKHYSGSPLMVNMRLHNVNSEVYSNIAKRGFFFIKGDGEIDYVQYFHPVTMNNVSYGIITDFRVRQLCWLNYIDGFEQILFE